MKEFTIKVQMSDYLVNQFCSILKRLQKYGKCFDHDIIKFEFSNEDEIKEVGPRCIYTEISWQGRHPEYISRIDDSFNNWDIMFKNTTNYF